MRFATDEGRQAGVELMGHQLQETMLYWETVDQASLDDSDLEWIAIWKPLPKVVFSATLPAVQGNARLASWFARCRRSSGCEPSRGKATSRSAARLSPPRRPRWA